MATPNARRIAFGTSVTSRNQVTREDGNIAATILDPTIAKRFGGKGIVTTAADQLMQGWVDTAIQESEIDGLEDEWQTINTHWDDLVPITSTDHTIRHDSEDCNFVYIKNTGDVEARLFLDGTEPDILIPSGASVSIRLNEISAEDIKVDVADGADPTTIEFVVAKSGA